MYKEFVKIKESTMRIDNIGTKDEMIEAFKLVDKLQSLKTSTFQLTSTKVLHTFDSMWEWTPETRIELTLDMLGFAFEKEEEHLKLVRFNRRIGDELIFLAVLRKFITGEITWIKRDGTEYITNNETLEVLANEIGLK